MCIDTPEMTGVSYDMKTYFKVYFWRSFVIRFGQGVEYKYRT